MSERDYVRPGGVAVEPESLEQFAEWMGTDHQAFEEAHGAVDRDCFAGVLQPYVFAGETNEDAGGGLPEAVDYHRAYSELENAMRVILMQIEGGLLALQTAATFVHTTYSFTDGFGAGQLENAFASYLAQDVRDVFSGNGIPVDRLRETGETEMAGNELPLADERWQRELEEQRGLDLDEETDHNGDGTANPERPPEVRYYDRVQHMDVDVSDDQASLEVPGSFPTREPQPHPTLEDD